MPTVPCPTCNRPVEWSAKYPWRPFCTERCKLIDLGAWAAEKHAIPGEPVEEHEQHRSDSSDQTERFE